MLKVPVKIGAHAFFKWRSPLCQWKRPLSRSGADMIVSGGGLADLWLMICDKTANTLVSN